MAGRHFQIFNRVPRPAARWARVLGVAIAVGLLGGLAAAALEWGLDKSSERLIRRFAPNMGQPELWDFNLWVLVLPTVGGLLSGLFVQGLFRQKTTHGTDLYVEAFHRHMGQLPLTGPVVKSAGAVGVISCGGSAGPEGPIAALGAALGSAVGKLLHLSPHERRIALVAGCGAGVGAVFRCPLGGALFATSVLYREEEFEADAIVPAFVASVLGYSVYIELLGAGSYLLVSEQASLLQFRSAYELIPYAILGVLCGVVSRFFSRCLFFVQRQAGRLALPIWLRPALGGLLVGLLACVVPQVVDGRYEFITNAIRGFDAPASAGWWVLLFAAVVVAKCAATGLTVGSGASGGVLGPSVFVGGATGALLGATLQAAWPALLASSPHLNESLIAVGLGGVLAAGMRTPLAAIVMVSEMSGSYGLIVPSMLVCMTSYVIGRQRGLNPQQVRSAAESPTHAGDAVIHLLQSWTVRDLMEPRWDATVAPEAPFSELVERIRPGTRPVFAVAREGRLLGVISVLDIQRVIGTPGLADAVIAADMMTEKMVTLHPDEDIYGALETFRRSKHDVLPVMQPAADKPQWVGMLTRVRVMDALRETISDLQKSLFEEHAGLAAIGREAHLREVFAGISPAPKSIVQQLFVPIDALGKSLREADFRRQYGAQVIGLLMADGRVQCPPDLDAPLEVEHRLLAIVDPQQGKQPPGAAPAAAVAANKG